MKITVIGSTSEIAKACLERWLVKGIKGLTLVGRNTIKLQEQQNDIAIRFPQTDVAYLHCDFDDSASIDNTSLHIARSIKPDIVLICHGLLPTKFTQESLENVIWVNGTSTILFLSALAKEMENFNATIAVIGSVAGDLGRKANYQYGAAKALVATYAHGLQHELADKRLKITLVKPGPVDTPMTAQLDTRPALLADVNVVAADIVRAIEKQRRTIYVPRVWRLIMLILTHMPFFIFKKLNI